MKKTIFVIVFLFLIVSGLLAQNNSNLKVEAYKNFPDTANFVYKNYLVASWQGRSENYFNILNYIFEIIDSINVDISLKWEIQKQKDIFFVRELKKREILGSFVCVERTNSQIIFYAQGVFQPKGLMQGLLAISRGSLKRQKVLGQAYFFIDFWQDKGIVQNYIKFCLDTNSNLANLYINILAKEEAKNIFETVVTTFKLVANK